MDILNSIWEFFTECFSAVFDFLKGTLGVVFFWLPDDPFSAYWPQLESFAQANITAIKWLNWFVPVPAFATVFSLVLSALLVWITYMCMTHVMDWIKTIKQTINPGG